MELDKKLAPIIEDAQRIWKFRWPALLCAWLAAAGGWLVVRALPDEYAASARVYVNAETVLKPLLQGLTVPTDPIAQIDLMTRAMLSRSHLEKVVAATGLEARAGNRVERDKLLARLENRIVVTKWKDQPNEQIYEIEYSDSDPVMAYGIVQALLNDLMADSMSGGKAQSADAKAFVEEQIELYEQRLTEAEDRLADFKRKNMGLLQGGIGADADYYSRFQAAQSAVTSLQTEIRSLTNRRNELARQLAGEESGSSARGPGVRDATSVDTAIASLETELAQLRLRFTERHPDVVRVKQTLEDLYRIREEEIKTRTAGGGGPRTTADPVYQQMKMALSAADADLAALRSQLAEKSAQVNYLRGMANTIPEVEAQFVRLNRDYDVVKKEYETLLQRLESVKMNQEVQADQKDVLFKVLEPPRTPLLPAGPDRLRLNTMVLVGALGFGFAIAFILSHRDPAFFSAASLRDVAGLPVYGLIGIAGATSTERQGWRFGIATGTLLLAYALILAFGETPIR